MTEKTRGIGFKNRLPWPKLKADMEFFASITTKTASSDKLNAVIMGRHTWDSIPPKFRPLPNRLNVIITSTLKQLQDHKDTVYVGSLDQALQYCYSSAVIEDTYVIGGQQVYADAINRLDCSKLLLTKVDGDYECDRFFPNVPGWMRLTDSKRVVSDGISLNFETYDNIADPNSDELQYTALLKEIVETGESKDGRNGKTLSIFGPQHIFDLQKGFPLLTTKKMFFDGIVKELIFFLRGETDANILSNQGVKIWNENSTREFLDSRGLKHYKVGDIGPMYGFNFRFFGAPYEGCDANYASKGYDQLWHLVNSLVNDKNSRRHLMTTFNPATVSQSVLAPCHGLTIQFNVRSTGELDCKMYQRS
jgi:dihydrofolate reductase/thymidylate synthase